MNSFNLLFCVLYHTLFLANALKGKQQSDESVENEDLGIPANPRTNKQYQTEIAMGDTADLFSTNIHKDIPQNFPEFGRRFVPQYQYTAKSPSQIDDEAEDRLDKIVREALKNANQNNKEDEPIPVKAPPHVVLALARQSALNYQNSRNHQHEQTVSRQALRSGDYWNSVWKEEVPEPKSSLRTENRLESIKVKIMPGSKLYKLVSMTKDISPKFLYVINTNGDEEYKK